MAASPSGVLLGLYFPDDCSYRTLWIYDDGPGVRILPVPDLLISRQMGFWRMGSYTTLLEEESGLPQPETYRTEETHLWASPVNRRPVMVLRSREKLVKPPLAVARCQDTHRWINFISPSYVWYQTETGYECGVHPDREFRMSVTSIEGLDSKRTEISTMLGRPGVDALRQAIATAFAAARKDAGFECRPTVDLANWTIMRGRGAWEVEGWADTLRVCGYGLHLDIPVALPAALTGVDRLPKRWDMLAAEIPGLSDAFASPSGGLLVAITKEEIVAYRLDGEKLSEPAARYRPVRFCRVVMAQWAVGAGNIDRWTKQVRTTRQVRPIVRRS